MLSKILLTSLSVLAFSLASVTTSRAASYQVGMSNVDMTPNVSMIVMGNPDNAPMAEAGAYPGDNLGLTIRVVYISNLDGSEPVILVAADLVNICPGDSDFARDPDNYPGIPNLTRERIMINISHTHNAPSSCDSSVRVMDPLLRVDAAPSSNWRANVLRPKLKAAIQQAYDNREAANLRLYRNKYHMSVNRRTNNGGDLINAAGTGRANINPDNSHINGYDHTLDVVEIFRDDQSRKGVLFFYVGHPVLLQGDRFPDGKYYFHPEYPGFARKKIEDATPTVNDVAIFFQGAGGDVNAVSNENTTPYERTRIEGEKLGQRVLDVMAGTAVLPNNYRTELILPSQGGNSAFSRVWGAPFQTAAGNHRLGGSPRGPRRILSPAPALGEFASRDWQRWADLYCEGTTGHGGGNLPCSLKAGVTPDRSWDVEMQTVKVGNWRVAGFSHEAVSQQGLKLRERWPNDWVSVVSYINRTQNYLPTSGQLTQDDTCWIPEVGCAFNLYEAFVAQLWNGHPAPWATFATTGGAYDLDTELQHVLKMETPQRVNYANAWHGTTASASSTLDSNRLPSAVINGDRKGIHWGSDPATGSGWHDATANGYPDSIEVAFQADRTIDEIDVFTVQDNYNSPTEPTEATTFTLYGIADFEVQYWDGSAWSVVKNGAVVGNNKIWRKFNFAPVTTTKIRVSITAAASDYSRIAEIEAWGAATSRPNVALASKGATATASSTLDADRAPLAAINGDRKGIHWGSDPATGSGWHDATNAFPDWLEVTFAGQRTINEVRVFSVQDNFNNPAEPTEATTFTLYGAVNLEVEYWDGAQWLPVPGASVTGNNLVWCKFIFMPVTTSKIRIVVHDGGAGKSRIVEVEALTPYDFLSSVPA